VSALLADKVAVIYGGGGAIGAASARVFAREGARVFLAGRTREKLLAVAREIEKAGGHAAVTALDVFDASAVEAHADAVAREAGRIDVMFNAIAIAHEQGKSFLETPVAASPARASWPTAYFQPRPRLSRASSRRSSGRTGYA
jgi:3-oxoacyl-[acyl-carrier protein] reductase